MKRLIKVAGSSRPGSWTPLRRGTLLLALLAVCVAVPPASATSYVRMTDTALADRAPLIVVARILGARTGHADTGVTD